MKRSAIILGLLLFIVAVEILILAPDEIGFHPYEEDVEVSEAAPEPPTTNEAGQVINNFHLVESNGDTKEFEVWAKRALRQEGSKEEEQASSQDAKKRESGTLTLDEMRVRFFGKNGTTYTVNGDHGIVMLARKDMKISGHVRTETSNGYEFEAEQVMYNSGARLLKSPQSVKMMGPKSPDGDRLLLTGKDLVADLNTNEMLVKENVRAQRKIKGDRNLLITSQSAEFSGRSNYARFLGEVVIHVDSTQITGPSAQFNYKPSSDVLDSVDVLGGVKVTDVDKFATANQVSVQLEDDRFIFRGSPRVVQNGDELSGEEIVFHEGGKRVQVRKASPGVPPITPRTELQLKSLEKKP